MHVCIIGNDATGKSTAADSIIELHKQAGIDNIKVVSFATPLKRIFEAYQIPVYSKPYSNTTRNLLRYMGDAMRETHGEDYWVTCLFNGLEINDNKDTKTNTSMSYIVDDMRYWSEYEGWMKKFPDSYIVVIGHPQIHAVVDQKDMPRSVVEVNQLIHHLTQHSFSDKIIHLTGTPEQNYLQLQRELKL